MTSTPKKEIPSNVVDKKWLCCYSARHSSLDERAGKWLLFGNRVNHDSHGLTDLDRLWSLVKDIVGAGKLCCAKCSTSVNDDGDDAENGVVMCFTHDHRDKREVKNAAAAIREYISYHKDMYYKSDMCLNSSVSGSSIVVNNSIYKFTTKGGFYERDDDGISWRAVECGLDPDPADEVSDVAVCATVDAADCSTSSRDRNVNPSKDTERYWIWCYGKRVHPSGDRNVGKWMLFGNRIREDSMGLTDLDRLWSLVKQVVQDGKLYGAKCSTAKMADDSTTEGVIICYTYDYTNKSDVKNSGDAIRDYIDYPREIYYKTDVATGRGLYVDSGDKAVSLYKHTRRNQFFERDSDGVSWKLVVLDEE